MPVVVNDNSTAIDVRKSARRGKSTYAEIQYADRDLGISLTATETRAVIAALQATLPAEEEAPTENTHNHIITTAAELDSLPVGARVVDNEGDVWTRRDNGKWTLRIEPEAYGPRRIPASYLPGTLLNPEILDAEPEPTTVGTLRLDLRLFLGDRDITYALANPIADALEGEK